jgi:hypothetical protein
MWTACRSVEWEHRHYVAVKRKRLLKSKREDKMKRKNRSEETTIVVLKRDIK